MPRWTSKDYALSGQLLALEAEDCETGAAPGVAEPTHTYGDQGIDLDPGEPEGGREGTELPASTEGALPPEYLEDEQELRRFTAATGVVLATQVCSCGTESPAGAKFCAECGEPFTVAAAEPEDWRCQGGHGNRPEDRFCPQCGDQRPDLRAPVAGAGVLVEMLARPGQSGEVLTPAQRAERERQHAEALRLGATVPPVHYQPPRSEDTVLFHILKSGWTFAGQVWYRGQEIELDVGSPRWQEAQRFLGMSDADQYETYGRVCFRLGGWPGRKAYSEIEPGSYQPLAALDGKGTVTGPSAEALAHADAQERARRRGVPAPAFR